MSDDILDHYVSRFGRVHPGGVATPRTVGMEAKFCLTDSDGNAVSAGFLEDLFTHLGCLGWGVLRDGNLGISTGAIRESDTCPAVVSTGTGHCKIEFSVPYGESIVELESNFSRMVKDVKCHTVPSEAHLLCLGVHPVTEPEPGMVQKKMRHIFWDEVFKSGLLHLFTISSDCQVHVAIGAEEAHSALNVLQGFAGPQIALTANATVWQGSVDLGHVDVREAFWDWWLDGEDRAGVARVAFSSLEDYVRRISSMRPVFVEREGKSLGIYRYPSFQDYYCSNERAVAVTGEGREVTVIPEEKDIDLHDTFNWYACRLSHYGTVENRANCQQPPEDIMSVPALTLGLVENVDKAADFIAGFEWSTLRQLRDKALIEGPEAAVGDLQVLDLSEKMLMLAGEGLASRGMGEQEYLAPLWERLRERSCPALECRRLFEHGGTGALLERYSL